MIQVDDALTSVRKADWQRLVRAVVEGDEVLLSDPGLRLDVAMVAPRDCDQLVTSTSLHGRPIGSWALGRAAAWLRGRPRNALAEALLSGGLPELADPVWQAILLVLPVATETVEAGELTAAAGRRLLRTLAGDHDDAPVGATILTPATPLAHVVLGPRYLLDGCAIVTYADGPDEPTRHGALMAQPVAELADVVGTDAWVAEQSGRPWTAEHATQRLLAAARKASIPVPPPPRAHPTDTADGEPR